MAPRAPPKKPTGQERVDLMRGPLVDIYVGAQRKHYSLPKRLLSYYSDYFSRCFSSNFVEGQSQTLTLDEDHVDHFDVLVEYMTTGYVMNSALQVKDMGIAGMQTCMNFLDYVDKYGLGDAAFAVHDSLERVISSIFTLSNGYKLGVQIQPCNVETVFRVTPPGHPLRSLIAKAALSTAGVGGHTFQKQEQEVEGFAAELLAQTRMVLFASGIGPPRWVDPFTRVTRFG